MLQQYEVKVALVVKATSAREAIEVVKEQLGEPMQEWHREIAHLVGLGVTLPSGSLLAWHVYTEA